MLKKISIITGTFLLALVAVRTADAAVLENAYVRLNNPTSGQSGVTHTYTFTTINDALGGVIFTYCTTASGTCNDAGEDVSAVTKGPITLAGVSDDGSNEWTVTGNDNTHQITAQRNVAHADAAGNWVFTFNTITNPLIANCANLQSTATCYVRIVTYTDSAGNTVADRATVSMTVTQEVTISATVDPTFTMVIAGVDGNVEEPTGWTPLLDDDISTTVTTVPFGNLTAGTPNYAAHKITISTNASGGYAVTARMVNNMIGQAYLSEISPFANGAQANTTSVAWAEPTGNISGTNTGWLGIGTTDTDVLGSAVDQFFPLGTTAQTVISSTSSANNDTQFVVYGIEVNNFQRADTYSGTMRINALPTY